MSIRQTIEVELEDRDMVTVVVDGRDLRAWEAWRQESALSAETTYTKFTEWAYLAGVRAGHWNGKYEDWEPGCVGVRVVRTDAPNPTRKDRTGGPSSPSRSAAASPRSTGKKQGKKP